MYIAPGSGRQPPWFMIFYKHKPSVNILGCYCKFLLLDVVLKDNPIKCIGEQVCPSRKVGHGQPLAIIL